MKTLLKRLLPKLYLMLASIRFHIVCRIRFGKIQNQFRKSIYKQGSISVLYGPFEGLSYFNSTVWGPITPKWIGSYEAELHNIISGIIDYGYNHIMDVGSAEGYYAVGLASKIPAAMVDAFDVDPIARYRLRKLAQINAVKNLRIHSECRHHDFQSLIESKTLIICDIEGHEQYLLDPLLAPKLERCDLLIEVHPYANHGMLEVEQTLLDRFSNSHLIMRIPAAARNADSWILKMPILAAIPRGLLQSCLEEHRSNDQIWLWLKCLKPL